MPTEDSARDNPAFRRDDGDEGTTSTVIKAPLGGSTVSLFLTTRLPLWRRLVALALLTAYFFLGFLDRYATAGVLPQLQTFYGISSGTAGSLQLGYIGVFIVCSIAIGVIGNRVGQLSILLSTGVLLAASSLASSFIPRDLFWLFFILRSLAGAGVAAICNLGPTLIAEYFEDGARGYALMILFAMMPFGASLGISLGAAFVGHGDAGLAWSLRPAPLVFVPVLILMAVFLKEPAAASKEAEVRASFSSVCGDIKAVLGCWTFRLMALGLMAANFYLCAMSWWISGYTQAAMDAKNHSTNIYHNITFDQLAHASKIIQRFNNEAMMIQSICGTVAGIVGSLAVVAIAERWLAGAGPFRCIQTLHAPLLTLTAGALLWGPAKFAYHELIEVDIIAANVINFLGNFANGALFPITSDVILAVIPPPRRTTANALLNILISATGDAPAPFIAGLIIDGFEGADHSPASKSFAMKMSLHISSAISLITIAATLAALRFYRRDLQRAVEATNEQRK